MSTHGELRMRIVQTFPGLHRDLVEGWIADRYAAILDRLEWQRQHKESWLQTVAYYETGTVAVASGGTALTGTDTVWTAAMTGRRIRIAGRPEWYTFTRTGATTGTIERAYEGETETAASYRIYQPIYALPSDCKILEALRSHALEKPLEKVSAARLNEIDSSRQTYGDPEMYVLTFDDGSDPPLMQVELWPAPQYARGLPVEYTREEDTGVLASSTTLLPWMRPAALVEGVSSDACLHLAKDNPNYGPLADRHELRFEARVADMIRTECLNQPGEQLSVAARFTRHRQRRWMR